MKTHWSTKNRKTHWINTDHQKNQISKDPLKSPLKFTTTKTQDNTQRTHWNWTQKSKQHKHSAIEPEWMKYREITITQQKPHEEDWGFLLTHPIHNTHKKINEIKSSYIYIFRWVILKIKKNGNITMTMKLEFYCFDPYL